MLHLIAHLHIHPGREQAFRDYERRALKIFRDHGGVLIGAFRPEQESQGPSEKVPFEIHVLSIPSEEAWAAYRADPGIMALTEERQRAILRTDLFVSKESISY